MSRPSLSGTSLATLLVAVAAAIVVLEYGLPSRGHGALLFTLVLWTALAQGSVAVVAVTDLTNARWAAAVKPQLLVAARLLPFLALLFLLLGPQLDQYRWAATPGAWLSPRFFMARNAVVLFAAAGVAQLFAASSLRRAPGAKRLAVLYMLLFVVTQTLVAFDWVMSLAYPWVSSMLGMFFCVEALYAGLALAGLLFLLLDRERSQRDAPEWGASRRDASLLIFGFSVLWGGLFFAQYLLLWYGNLPEEVGFIVTRIGASPTRELAPLFIACCFGVPFGILISARAKRSAAVLACVSASILIGLASERLFLMLPELRLHWGNAVVENLLLLLVWLAVVLRPERLLPAATGLSVSHEGGVE